MSCRANSAIVDYEILQIILNYQIDSAFPNGLRQRTYQQQIPLSRRHQPSAPDHVIIVPLFGYCMLVGEADTFIYGIIHKGDVSWQNINGPRRYMR